MNKKTSDIIVINKPIGLTPMQAIIDFKKKNKEYIKESISHAGKLDPLAEGLLLLVTGKKTFKLKKFLRLEKEYQAKILFGISTDSFDIQGIPKSSNYQDIDKEKISEIISSFMGEYEQEIPVFSGKKVNRRPLFYYARMDKLSEIKIPVQKVLIKNITLDYISKIDNENLLKDIIRKINSLTGDFRQDEIRKAWRNLLTKEKKDYITIDITVTCSSGTYIRGLAKDIGKKLGTEAILLGLKRTRIGKFTLRDVTK
ncbi:MAG: hypothetical protein WC867_04125 [Candidatus Pacearchaeota archaeon]|jgi:tRNA pseudouridine55 synthase